MYKKIPVSSDITYIKLFHKPNNELKTQLEMLEKSNEFTFSRSTDILYYFENLNLNSSIDEIFEKYAIPLIDCNNKQHNFQKLSSGQYKNTPLYCIPSDYLLFIFNTTLDKKIKEYISKILKKRLFF